MFPKMNWPSRRFERTDSEHNFMLLSERFNLTRVTISVAVTRVSGTRLCPSDRSRGMKDTDADANAKPGKDLFPSAQSSDCRDAPGPVASLLDGWTHCRSIDRTCSECADDSGGAKPSPKLLRCFAADHYFF